MPRRRHPRRCRLQALRPHAGAGRGQLRGPRQRAVRAARAQRRRQDDAAPHPLHDPASRQRHGAWSPASTWCAQPLAARSRLGIVFQEPSLDDRLTVRENLNLHGLVFGVPRKLRRAAHRGNAGAGRTDRLGATSRCGALSSGMKRRLEIARALIHDSEILLLDEPTVGLDAQTRERIWAYLRRLQAERELTVLVTTHYIEEVENCDRVCIIDHGKVLAARHARRAEARARPGSCCASTPRDDADRAEILARYRRPAGRRGRRRDHAAQVRRRVRRDASSPSSARRIRALAVERAEPRDRCSCR